MASHGTRTMYGKGCRCPECVHVHNEYARKWMAANGKPIRDRHRAKRRAILDALKGKPCAECGTLYPPYVMEFDHLGTEEKQFNIGSGNRFSLTTLVEEISKTEVVCANCHRLRTYNRATYGVHPAPAGASADELSSWLDALGF